MLYNLVIVVKLFEYFQTAVRLTCEVVDENENELVLRVFAIGAKSHYEIVGAVEEVQNGDIDPGGE